MAGPRNTSANKAHVVVEFPDDLSNFIGQLNAALDEAALDIAKEILVDAQGSAAFRDYTGTARESEWHKKHFPNATRLRPKMRAQKSKYPGGGAIVIASAPHAHLVEYGHVMVVDGKVAEHSVPAHSFLRSAKAKHVDEAISRFREALAKEYLP